MLLLPEELTIYTIGELRAAWLQWLDADVGAPCGAGSTDADADAVRLDGRAVQEVDAAGVQLLLSFARSIAQRQDRRLALIEPSDALQRACEALGVAHLLEPHATAEAAA